jgi:transposase
VIDEATRAEMRRLVLAENWRIGTVARRFSVHYDVVKRAVREESKPARTVTSPLEPYKDYIVERLQKYPELTATRLLLELRDRGYTRGVAVVQRFVAKLRGSRPRKAYLRVEAVPGEQAQVDWGSFGWIRIGSTQRPLSCFAMVLSWSRALFLDFALDQRLETFCEMHRRAFEYFEGVPQRILYDNLKTVVLHHVGSTVQFNQAFLVFAGNYLFEPTAAPPRYPQAKGRVEGSIRYIRHSFFYGRSFGSLEELRHAAARWRDDIANARVHAATRARPDDLLRVERARLRALPGHPPPTDLLVPAIVSKEASVRLDTNCYSVPPRFVGKTVHLRADQASVRVFAEGTEIARHARCWDRRKIVEDPAHREEILARRPGAQAPARRDRIGGLAPECKAYLQEVARRRIQLQNEVRKLERLLARYGEADFVEGVRRALVSRTFGARYVHACIDQARFARGLGEPPEPVVTGHHAADSLVVEPHDLETYDALFQDPEDHVLPLPAPAESGAAGPGGEPAPEPALKPEDG